MPKGIYKRTEETKKKIRESKKGKHCSPDTEFKKGKTYGIRKCFICRKEYTARSLIQIYCGNRKNKVGCAWIIRKKQMKKWWLSEKRKEDRKKYREKERISRIKWRNNNREKLRLQWAEKTRQKRKIPEIRILMNMRKRVSELIHKSRTNKNNTTIGYLGCSLPQFKEYLEKHFTNGMSFENYGKWQIDHIRPCNSFDLTKEDERQECFYYKNLQPLWTIDNLIKKDKYERKTATVK